MKFSHVFIGAFLDALLTSIGPRDGKPALRPSRRASMHPIYEGEAFIGANVSSTVQDLEGSSGSTEFGALLRRHRLAAGLSQEALAERARLSSNGIGALERGYRRRPQRQTLALLAGTLDLNGDEHAQFESAAR
jgi:ribosome-binding protein aMBF1 (putative translation factor)